MDKAYSSWYAKIVNRKNIWEAILISIIQFNFASIYHYLENAKQLNNKTKQKKSDSSYLSCKCLERRIY